MTQAELVFRHIEAEGERELARRYFAALTAQARGEPADWEEFGRILTRVLVLAHLVGRMGTVNSLRFRVPEGEAAFKRGELAQYADEPALLTGPFVSAVNWFLGKVPSLRRVVDRLLPAARKRAFWVTGIESREALERIQEKLAKPLAAEAGGGMSEFIHSEAEITGLAEARLETVYRTNTMGALAEGALEQMRSPELREGVALIQLNEIQDRRTRGAPGTNNPGKHWQMDGFVESPDAVVWKRITPPNGFQCRASLSPISWLTAERMGLAKNGVLNQAALDRKNAAKWRIIEAGEYPDPGFNP